MFARNRRVPGAWPLRNRPRLEPLEDRLTPAVTALFDNGLLTVTLGAPGDHTFLRRLNNKIDVGTTDGGTDVMAGQAGVTGIVVADAGANTGQAVTLSNHGAAYPQTITLTGIETADLYRATGKTVTGDADVVNVFGVGTRHGSIRNGVAMVKSGGTVNVVPGTYKELVTISMPLTLVGDPGDDQPGPGANAPTLDGTMFRAGARAITILGTSAHDVTIRGLNLVNWAVDASGRGGNGILGKSVANVTLEDNHVANTGGSPIYAAAPPNTDWTVRRNDVEDCGGYGIELDYMAGNVLVEENHVSAQASVPTTKAGVLVLSRSAPGPGPALTIHANTFEGSLSNAIYLKALAGGTIADAHVENNVVATNYRGVWVAKTGAGSVTGLVVRENSLVAGQRDFINATPTLVDASFNHWGKRTLTGPIDYSPALGGHDASSAVGFQGDFAALTVDSTSPQVGSLGRIEEAVLAAAPHATVQVPNYGTYDEAFSAAHDVTLAIGNLATITSHNGQIGLTGSFVTRYQYPGAGLTVSSLKIVGDLVLANRTTLSLTVTPGQDDSLSVSGAINLDAGPALKLQLTSADMAGSQFTLIRNDSGSPTTGKFRVVTFDHAAENAQYIEEQSSRVLYGSGAGSNDVALEVLKATEVATIDGELRADDPIFPDEGMPAVSYPLELKEGKTYIVQVEADTFKPWGVIQLAGRSDWWHPGLKPGGDTNSRNAYVTINPVRDDQYKLSVMNRFPAVYPYGPIHVHVFEMPFRLSDQPLQPAPA